MATQPQMAAQPRVAIIGAGVGGLATAALLAQDGYAVTIFEKNEQAGGRASLLEQDGFRFDMGPSWFLMPDVYERFFSALGASMADHLTLTRLTPHYRLFFPKGQQYDITGDLETDTALFESLEAGAGASFRRYLAEAQRKYETSVNSILYRNLTWRDFLDPAMRNQGSDLHVFASMERYVRRYFKTEIMQQIVQYTQIFLGGSPQKTPALYSLMSHVDFNLGVWYPQGGLYSVITALVKLGAARGVQFHYHALVDQIETHDEHVTGVRVGGQLYPFDYVISNADYAHTEQLLADRTERQYPRWYWDRAELAPSAFILYLGIRGELPALAHHNLIFSRDWTQHFRELTNRPIWPQTPSLYVCNPSKTDHTVAPPDHENLFVLVPIAPGLFETERSRREYATQMIQYVERRLNVELQSRIVTQSMFSVSDFSSRYNSLRGTALGLAHTLAQSSLLRPPNRSRKLNNLLFVGADTTPGIGVPMCLISAQLVRDQLRQGGT